MQSSPSVPQDALKSKKDRHADGEVAVRSVTIGKPREEVYAFFRKFSNLGRFMENIERVDELDQTRSHWVVKGPAGQTVEWDAILTQDEPGRLIAWETAEGAQIRNHGTVEFKDAPGGRGVELYATLVYEPPIGAFGKAVAEMFAMEPGMQAKRDLRRLKMLLESGEIATSAYPDAAPRYKKADASPEARDAEVR